MDLLTRTSGFIALVFVLTTTVQIVWSICLETCNEDYKGRTLKLCQEPAARLEEIEPSANVSLEHACNRLHDLLECVGEKVPQCLDDISEQYQEFTYSPWDCHTSKEQVIVYQKLVEKGCTSKTESQSDPNNDAIYFRAGGMLVIGMAIFYILTS